MRPSQVVGAFVFLGVIGGFLAAEEKGPRTRTFQFRYEATIKGLKPGEDVKVWLPLPQTTADQTDKEISRNWSGSSKESTVSTEKEYGNKILHFTAQADDKGQATFQIVHQVTRREVKGEGGKGEFDSAKLLKRFQQPDKLVPVSGKPLDLI